MQTILVPLDLSERSPFAVREAASIAAKFDARLLLLHAVQAAPSADYEGGEFPAELEAYAAEELANLVTREAPQAQTETLIVSGDVGQSIRRVCEERGVDLIVMPTRGQGSYRRFLLGSNTAKTLHDAPCPVLTGAHLEHPEQACYPYNRIACLLDLRDGYQQVFAYARQFADSYDAELTVIHLAPAFSLDLSRNKDFLEALEGSARLRLEKLVNEENAKAQIIVKSGAMEATLPRLVEHGRLDLLVISRKYAGAHDQELGVSSEAYAAIRCSPCPVLSI